MAAPAEFGRRLEAHRFQIVPAGGIVGHGDAVVVAQANAGVFKHAPDGGVEFAGDFGLLVSRPASAAPRRRGS